MLGDFVCRFQKNEHWTRLFMVLFLQMFRVCESIRETDWKMEGGRLTRNHKAIPMIPRGGVWGRRGKVWRQRDVIDGRDTDSLITNKS